MSKSYKEAAMQPCPPDAGAAPTPVVYPAQGAADVDGFKELIASILARVAQEQPAAGDVPQIGRVDEALG